MPKRVLFLCTHNSARSQMAEGWLNHLGDGGFEAHSAGSVSTLVRPEAVAVMEEVGIDLSKHESKTLDRYLYEPLDVVVTVCDRARDSCPTFPHAASNLHWSLEDPASVEGSVEERRAAFRKTRDDLRARILAEIAPSSSPRGEHFAKLERMYRAAPTNAYYRPKIEIVEAGAHIEIEVKKEFFHAAGGVHGSVYFKALDDACFFAAASLVTDVFVLTTQFNIHLIRPISEGLLSAVGRVRHATKNRLLATGELRDGSGALLARGEGTFVRSRIRLAAELGYQ